MQKQVDYFKHTIYVINAPVTGPFHRFELALRHSHDCMFKTFLLVCITFPHNKLKDCITNWLFHEFVKYKSKYFYRHAYVSVFRIKR